MLWGINGMLYKIASLKYFNENEKLMFRTENGIYRHNAKNTELMSPACKTPSTPSLSQTKKKIVNETIVNVLKIDIINIEYDFSCILNIAIGTNENELKKTVNIIINIYGLNGTEKLIKLKNIGPIINNKHVSTSDNKKILIHIVPKKILRSAPSYST